MAINASAEVIRDMKSTLSKTVTGIQGVQQNIKAAKQSATNWNDSQGQQYQALMQQISRLTDSPVSSLNAAIPKLEKLAKSLDDYNKVKF